MVLKILPTIHAPRDLRALTVPQLEELAQEIRFAIYEQVSNTGGHLAPNLGVVELTLALHYVFDFGHDRLLFDVGHQCYPHKLVTGRYPLLSRLRTREGMAGFPEPRESAYDLFSVGHAGTAISTAVGMARGDDVTGESFHPEKRPAGRRVVSLVGDAAIVNGLAMEGLNAAGMLRRQFLIVLNDNGMSIARPQGAVAAYLDRVRTSRTYQHVKRAARDVVKGLPGGSLIEEMYHRMGEMTKAAMAEDAWFEKFGIVTLGPVDGHSLTELIGLLAELRDFDRPVVLHAHTIKGKGYEVCEADATTFHSPKPFKIREGKVELQGGGRSFTSAFGDAMADLMAADAEVVACTAAMPGGTGIEKVMPKFPDRVWDTGICESHAMDMMAGMAKCGLKPFFAVYSTFLQRAFDQAFQEVTLQELPVRLCLDRAGLVGGDGAVHHGFCDISILRVFPGSVLMAAMDEASLRASLEFMRTWDKGLTAVRYPRDSVSDRFAAEPCPPFELGRARPLAVEAEPDLAILALGPMAITAMDVRERLQGEYRLSVYDARFAKPVDLDLIRTLIEAGTPILTIEDHGITGGFGASVLEACHDAGLPTAGIHRLGIPERWIYQNSRSKQLAEVGLDVASIATTICELLDANETAAEEAVGGVNDGARTPSHAASSFRLPVGVATGEVLATPAPTVTPFARRGAFAPRRPMK